MRHGHLHMRIQRSIVPAGREGGAQRTLGPPSGTLLKRGARPGRHMDTLCLLDACAELLGDLRDTDSPLDLASPASVPSTGLEFSAVQDDALSEALRSRPLADDVHAALVGLYERHVTQLKHMYSTWFQSAQRRWAATYAEHLPLFRQLFEVQCEQAAREVRQVILALVDERLERFQQDARTAAVSKPGGEVHRGHSEHALAILENAFEHAPNITHAEKHTLAQMTGLQPRQVTIWFQNRRNRKPRGAQAASTSTTSTAAPATVAPPPPRLGPVPAARMKRKQPPASPASPMEAPPTERQRQLEPCAQRMAGRSPAGSSAGPLAFRAAQPSTPEFVPMPVDPGLEPFETLDAMIDMDDAQQSLVFSPLDSLPRLDLDDLGLDLAAMEQTLALGVPPAPVQQRSPCLFRVAPCGIESAQSGLQLARQLVANDEPLIHLAVGSQQTPLTRMLTPLHDTTEDPSALPVDACAVLLEGLLHPASERDGGESQSEPARLKEPNSAPASASRRKGKQVPNRGQGSAGKGKQVQRTGSPEHEPTRPTQVATAHPAGTAGQDPFLPPGLLASSAQAPETSAPVAKTSPQVHSDTREAPVQSPGATAPANQHPPVPSCL